MMLRTWFAGFVTLLLAAHGFAEVKTYTLDVDNSTLVPADRRIYRGDCDANAVTPNAGDTFDDQCACTPNVNCAIGQVPDAECSASDGRPNGGTPAAIPEVFEEYVQEDGWCVGGWIHNAPCLSNDDCPPDGTCNIVRRNHDFVFHGAVNAPCNLSHVGPGVINDTGNGTPTLISLQIVADFNDWIGGAVATGIPGTTVALSSQSTIGPAPNQTGAGSTSTSINWGTLTGWTQTGRLFCKTNCPGGCSGKSVCTPLLGFEGVGPPTPLKASSFNTDPWVFAGGGTSFTTAPFEVVSLGGGTVTASMQLGGRLVAVPALPLAALGGLAVGLVYLGAQALRRMRD